MQVDDSNTFPSVVGSTFPNNFKDIVKKIFKRLFRVYAHIYRSHFHEVCQLKAEAHLNTCFKHFMLFAKVLSLHQRCLCNTAGCRGIAYQVTGMQ
jgi:MOB kinase activator 1